MNQSWKNVYELLSRQYRNEQEVMTEIINLQAIMNLPKGTEHFLSDLHGEAETFKYLLRNASGVIRTKIDLAFGNTLVARDKKELERLICYPKQYLKMIEAEEDDVEGKHCVLMNRLIEIIKLVAAKYTRSKVRKALPPDYRYIIDELINIPEHSIIKADYYDDIIKGIIELGNSGTFIHVMCDMISRLAIDHMHIVGDIYDRGQAAAEIIRILMRYHALDIEWGNHDILWMGAHFGNAACVCNILRINCLYRNLQTIESDYGINLRPLVTFATEEYANDDTAGFSISDIFGAETDFEKNDQLAKMTKAITVIQLKLENQMIKRHPEFHMDDRCLYPTDELTPKEDALIRLLTNEFVKSKRLDEHIRFLLAKGSVYKVFNGNLLFHGCIPTESDGSFSCVTVANEKFSGKALCDRIDRLVRDAAEGDNYGIDFMWYLWCGRKSPFYGRDKMCVYTKYFEGHTEQENKDPYYDHIKNEDFCIKILQEFGADEEYSTIINGHIPVKVKDGERPERPHQRHIIIDGGFSRAYHDKTGIGGFTLISNSQGMFLVSHSKDVSPQNCIPDAIELESEVTTIKTYKRRILVKETDHGKAMQNQINILKSMLTEHYRANSPKKSTT